MKFYKTKLQGSFTIKLEKVIDKRGFFSRVWDKEIFEKFGLSSTILQSNISFNKKKGTIRGMHYQASPHEEIKLVRCTKGKAFEVMLDLRSNSKTYMKW